MLYVAYGSNTNLEQMEFRCPNSTLIGNGKIKGWKLVFNIHADIVKGKKTDEVPVVIWDIHYKDWESLDIYEGYPEYYIRKKIKVQKDSGKEISAIVYVMTKDRKGFSPPMERYFNVCEAGYIENGLDTKYLYDALRDSWENETFYNQYNPKP